MSERFSTAGMWLGWKAESTAGVRPTGAYTLIPEVKSMPSFNPSPETIQSTTLLETEYHTYVKGLKDLGGALEYSANLTDDLITEWGNLLSAFDTAVAQGKHIWFVVAHPNLSQATYFTGDPSSIGLNEASVGGMAETTLYITPTGSPVMASRPEKAEATNANLTALLVGTNLLDPPFAPNTTTYAVATFQTSDKIVTQTATAGASVVLASEQATISTDTVTWASGSNVVTVTVTAGGASKVYTLNVTKS